jgi:hypothetical protein
MKTKADLKKIARNIWRHHHGKRLRTPSIMHPVREWVIGVLLALVGVVLVGAWSGYTYLQNRDVVLGGMTIDTPNQGFYNGSTVDDALEIIAAREQVIERFQTASVDVMSESELTATSTDPNTEEPNNELEPLVPPGEGAPEVPAIFDGDIELVN